MHVQEPDFNGIHIPIRPTTYGQDQLAHDGRTLQVTSWNGKNAALLNGLTRVNDLAVAGSETDQMNSTDRRIRALALLNAGYEDAVQDDDMVAALIREGLAQPDTSGLNHCRTIIAV